MLELVGTGRPDTPTAGWEYRYYGHKLPIGPPYVATVVDVLAGTVLSAKTHGESKAGEVFPIIAVRKQPFLPPSDQPFLRSEFAGLWTYRRFGDQADPKPVYKTAPQNAHELILQEAELKLETRPPTGGPCKGRLSGQAEGCSTSRGGSVGSIRRIGRAEKVSP